MRPRIYVTGHDDRYSRYLSDVASQLVRRGYAVYTPQFALLPLEDMAYHQWCANERAWLSLCDALLRIGDHPHEAEAWAKELDIPIFYAQDTLIACLRINGAVVVAENLPRSSKAIDKAPAYGTIVHAVESPSIAPNAATTAGTTAPTPGRRVSVPGRSGGMPAVVPNVIYDGEEWQCPGCDRRFMTEASTFDHVAVHHYTMLQGANPA